MNPLRWLRRRSTSPTAAPHQPDPLWLRAEKLRLLFLMEGEEVALSFEEVMRRDLFRPTRYQSLVIKEIAFDDYALFCAMREVASEQRERQYSALERFAALVNEQPGADVDSRFDAAVGQDVRAVAGCLVELGWLEHEAPDGD